MPPVSTPKSTPSISKDTESAYVEGENVLCFHGELLYEARVQALDTNPGAPKYLIHYMGWNSKWDEWVDRSRILKYTDNNLEKKKQLLRSSASNKASRKKNEGSATHLAKSDGQKSKPKGHTDGELKVTDIGKSDTESTDEAHLPDDDENAESGDATVQSEDQYPVRAAVHIKIPEELKSYLVDDWDYITRQRKLVKLPARLTVEQILDGYAKSKITKISNSKANAREAIAGEVIKGILEYFNVMVGSQLLYKYETEQHAEIIKTRKDVPLTQIYGSIHLLRLFVNLGGALSYTMLDDRDMSLLLHHIQDFLSYMKKNSSNLFMAQDYSTAPPEYHRSI